MSLFRSALDYVWGSPPAPAAAAQRRGNNDNNDDDDDDNKNDRFAPPQLAEQGRAPTSRGDKMAATIASMQENADLLRKSENALAERALQAKNEAVRLLNLKQKEKAVVAMKRAHMYERRARDDSGKLFNLEQQIIQLQSIRMAKQTAESMRRGTEMLRAVQKEIGPNGVAELAFEASEQVTEAQRISEELSLPIGAAAAADEPTETELLAEIEDYKLTTEGLADDPEFFTVSLPSTPSAAPARRAVAAAQEERELRQLQAEMNAS